MMYSNNNNSITWISRSGYGFGNFQFDWNITATHRTCRILDRQVYPRYERKRKRWVDDEQFRSAVDFVHEISSYTRVGDVIQTQTVVVIGIRCSQFRTESKTAVKNDRSELGVRSAIGGMFNAQRGIAKIERAMTCAGWKDFPVPRPRVATAVGQNATSEKRTCARDRDHTVYRRSSPPDAEENNSVPAPPVTDVTFSRRVRATRSYFHTVRPQSSLHHVVRPSVL